MNIFVTNALTLILNTER